MSDAGTTGPDPAGELSEEELRAYLGQLREAHVGEIVAQVLSMLLNAAQVKLGRPDARLMIDLTAALIERAGPELDPQFTGEVNQILTQLRTAQVQAEEELGRAHGAQDAEPSEPSPPPSSAPPAPGSQESSASSRLWVPGQG